jgi:sec-independent protein translocase protein TatA
MNVFGIGLPELAVIAAIGLLVFGPKRLPELGKTLGRTLRGFQSASQDFEKEFRTAIAPVEEIATVSAFAPATTDQVETAKPVQSEQAAMATAAVASVDPAMAPTPESSGSAAG